MLKKPKVLDYFKEFQNKIKPIFDPPTAILNLQEIKLSLPNL